MTGTSANDTFVAGVVVAADGTTAVDTLQAFDQLDGGAGTDTLNATINSGAATIAPTITNIENVTVRSTADGSGFSLSGSTGVEKITVANSTGTTVMTNVGAVQTFAVQNLKKNVTFDGGTATTIALSATNVGTVATPTVAAVEVDVNFDDNAFKTANLTVSNSNIELLSTTAGNDDLTSVTVAATGSNTVKLTSGATTIQTVTTKGSGSVDLTGVNLSAVKTLTAGDGGIKATVTNATAGAVTATTGSGDDTISVVGASVKSVSTGAGKDSVTIATSALSATSIVDLGAGDDTLTLGAAPTAGATINGGDGTDTISLTAANYGTVAGYTDANRAKISNFEVLSISDALANASTTDVSKLTGVTSFTAAQGVVAGGTANVTNLGANSTVTIAGTNTAAVAQVFVADFSASTAVVGADTITFDGETITLAGGETPAQIAAAVAGGTYANWTAVDNGDGTVTFTASTAGASVDTVAGDFTIVDAGATGTGPAVAVTVDTSGAAAVGGGTLAVSLKTDTSDDVVNLVLKNDYTENNDATSTITDVANSVTANLVETINVTSTGKGSATFAGAEGTKADGVKNILTLTDDALVTLNVSGDQAFSITTAGTQTKLATIDASALTAGATIDAKAALSTSAALTIKGSATEANTLLGGAKGDTVVGGAKADTITGGKGGDTITGNGGNDTFVFAAGDSSIGSGTFDTITDFVGNTKGNADSGAISANADSTLWTGDVLSFTVSGTANAAKGIKVFTASSAADATTFLANTASADNTQASAALDSSGNNLYVDMSGDGIADFYISLTGVASIEAASFVIA